MFHNIPQYSPRIKPLTFSLLPKVLTAAHCTKGMTPSKIGDHVVSLGAHDQTKREPSVQQRRIKRVIRNPLYKPDKDTQADMALLELDEPVIMTKRVNVPCMPKEGVYPKLGKQCVIAGLSLDW